MNQKSASVVRYGVDNHHTVKFDQSIGRVYVHPRLLSKLTFDEEYNEVVVIVDAHRCTALAIYNYSSNNITNNIVSKTTIRYP